MSIGKILKFAYITLSETHFTELRGQGEKKPMPFKEYPTMEKF
jgi:hypothetical protein